MSSLCCASFQPRASTQWSCSSVHSTGTSSTPSYACTHLLRLSKRAVLPPFPRRLFIFFAFTPTPTCLLFRHKRHLFSSQSKGWEAMLDILSLEFRHLPRSRDASLMRLSLRHHIAEFGGSGRLQTHHLGGTLFLGRPPPATTFITYMWIHILHKWNCVITYVQQTHTLVCTEKTHQHMDVDTHTLVCKYSSIRGGVHSDHVSPAPHTCMNSCESQCAVCTTSSPQAIMYRS